MLLPSPSFPFVITIGVVPLPELFAQDLLELTVSTGLNIPGMFSIKLKTKNETETGITPAKMFSYLDPTPQFTVGMPVTIAAVNAQDSPIPSIPSPILSGEITAIEADFEADGTASIVLRGFDKSHRLTRGKKTATYMMQPDNVIVMSVAGKAAVPCVALPTPGSPREYVLQNNQSDWDFLRDIADRNGFVLVTDALTGMLRFQPQGVPTPGLPEILTWGDNLTSFRPGVTSATQVATALVQGADPMTGSKAPVVGPGLAPPPIIPPSLMPQLALSRTLFGINKETVVNRPTWGLTPPTPAMIRATGLAVAKATQRSGEFLRAEGECMGNPGLQAGGQIMVMGVGTTFSGPYLVTSVTHHYVPETGYTTQFSVSGGQTETLSSLINKDEDSLATGRIYGVVLGIVTNNSDPQQLGRVKVMLPHLGATPPTETGWCRQVSLGAGMLAGYYALPDIGDEVLVAFEHGDPSYPYVLGTLWNQVAMPPPPLNGAYLAGPKVVRSVIRSRAGHEISISDTPGKEGISIIDKTMMNKIEIDSTKQSVTISALGDVSIDCMNFKVLAKGMMEIKAVTKASVEGTAGLFLKGSPPAQIDLLSKTNINSGGLEVT